MADETTDLILPMLREMRADISQRLGALESAHAKDRATIENMDATLTRMHADVVDAKATGKEVAVRLSLIELRLGKVDDRLDKIEQHLGMVDA